MLGSWNMLTGIQFSDCIICVYGEDFVGRDKSNFSDLYVSRVSCMIFNYENILFSEKKIRSSGHRLMISLNFIHFITFTKCRLQVLKSSAFIGFWPLCFTTHLAHEMVPKCQATPRLKLRKIYVPTFPFYFLILPIFTFN